MRPRKTPTSNFVYRLPGGNEDNDLHCRRLELGVIQSDWELTDLERQLVVAGGRVQLTIYFEPIPPVSITITAPYCQACKGEMAPAWYPKERFEAEGRATELKGVWCYACRACSPDDFADTPTP